jgi:anhydro-N-acetylmuramic acid kinase
MASALYAGLMSGTSLDGVDGVLVDFRSSAPQVLQHVYLPFDPAFAAELLALNTPTDNELHRGALAANALARCYADVVQRLLVAAGVTADAVAAVGAHGQTVRHRPQEFDGCGYTVQLNNPSLLAELTGIDVVADFRSRDLSAGGQGAPLVPAFHQAVFGRPDAQVCVVNIGGISNLTVLAATGAQPQQAASKPAVRGFDCGPGNALMDYWCLRHTGLAFDRDGAWGDTGTPDPALLAQLLAEPYLARTPPKSTGRDLFNPDWLNQLLAQHGAAQPASPADVQATLCEFTAAVCANDLLRAAPDSRWLIVCGGGARNGALMRRLQARLPATRVEPSDAHGLPALQVEATAFAWLARKALARETGSLQSVTGAHGARVLGAIYPR